MNIIPVGQKVLMVSNNTNTTYGGSAALKAMQNWYTMGDLAMSAASPLSFTWAKTNMNQVNVSGNTVNYYELGIDFNNLIMEEGVKYTLLLDRHKPQERRNAVKIKKTRYAHETVADALINERFSELPIGSATGQFFDFIPYNYFVNGIGHALGFGDRKGKTRGLRQNGEPSGVNSITRFINLGFRMRIEKNGVTTETGILGTITMCSQYLSDGSVGNQFTIAYARPNS